MSLLPAKNKLQLIVGNSDAARLLRTKKWELTGLHIIEKWPKPLLNNLNFVLNSQFPMFILWGTEHYFFYNDKWNSNFSYLKNYNQLVGETAEKVFGSHWNKLKPVIHDLFHSNSDSVGKDHILALTAEGVPTTTIWRISFCPILGNSDTVLGVVATINEDRTEPISDTTLLEKTTHEETLSELNAIVKLSDDAILSTTPDGLITSWNASATEIFGYKASEIIGQEVNKLLPLNKLKEEDLINETIKRGKRISKRITQRLTKSNDVIDVSFSAGPLLNSEGNIIGIMHIVRDITKQKQNEKLISENAERLQIVLSSSDLGTWELNLLNNQISYSKKYLEILGYQEPKDFTHTELLQHIHPDDVTIRENAMNKALLEGILNYDSRIIWPDKSVRWVEARGQVFYNKEKQPVKLIGTFRDVTERRSKVEELRESEQKFRILADSVPQLIWTGDANGNLNYFNLSLFEYSGLTPKQIHKEGWIQIVHPDDRLESVKLWAAAIDEGEPFLTEHRFKRYDGQYRWQLSRALPQKDVNGTIQMWVGSSTDVHDQKIFSEELERNVELRTIELKRAIEELVKTNQELEQFAYVSSHDLQEPLRKIQTFSGILSDKLNTQPESKQYLDKINASANRMSELIRDLLSYSKLSKTEELFVETDLNSILEKVKNDFEVIIQQKKAIIIAPRLPIIKAIPIQMNQLLYNLIGNSLKFCDKKPFIELSYKIASTYDLKNTPLNPSGKYYHLMFKDNGIGFSQEYTQQIFTIFQRLNDKQKYSGTGIGLAVCKKIIENHHGFISAESQVDNGATFNVFLPE
jgi:PAS domain S-box-containing protein